MFYSDQQYIKTLIYWNKFKLSDQKCPLGFLVKVVENVSLKADVNRILWTDPTIKWMFNLSGSAMSGISVKIH